MMSDITTMAMPASQIHVKYSASIAAT